MAQLESLRAWLWSITAEWQVFLPRIQERPYDWDWGGHPMMWGAWGFGMMIMMILFWALIIVGVVLGIRWLLNQGKDPRPDSALEILRQRYARGEIDKNEFESRKRDLAL